MSHGVDLSLILLGLFILMVWRRSRIENGAGLDCRRPHFALVARTGALFSAFSGHERGRGFPSILRLSAPSPQPQAGITVWAFSGQRQGFKDRGRRMRIIVLARLIETGTTVIPVRGWDRLGTSGRDSNETGGRNGNHRNHCFWHFRAAKVPRTVFG